MAIWKFHISFKPISHSFKVPLDLVISCLSSHLVNIEAHITHNYDTELSIMDKVAIECESQFMPLTYR